MTQKMTPRMMLLCIGCALLVFVNTGISNTCGYPFVVPISEELGLGLGPLGFMFTAQSIFLVIGSLLAGFLIKKLPLKPMVIAGGALIFIGWLMMANANGLPVLYAANALKGLGGVFCADMIAQIVIMNWFKQRSGTAVGIVGTMSSVAPAIFSTPVNMWLTTMGWRQLSIVIGFVSLIVTVICAVLFIWMTPQKIGLKPYGELLDDTGAEEKQVVEKAELPGITAQEAMKTKQFWLLAIASFLQMLVVVAISTQRTPIIMTKGVDLVQAGIIVSVVSLTGVIVKIIFGLLIDKKGCRFTYTGMSILYIIALLIGVSSMQGFGIAMVFGVLTAIYSAGALYASVGLKELFGQKDIGRLISFVNIGSMIGSVLGSIVMNTLVTITGTFNLALIVMIICALVSMLFVCAAHVKKNIFHAEEV